jgi:phosphoribosyl-AMP cyclohydrolase / phosphoribosyl-ATP pyrophosphohydrolase
VQINFEKSQGLVPAIIVHHVTQQVLMLGYMNQAALDQTLATKQVTFFSRSKNRLWVKGETSGNFLQLIDIQVDCDEDTLLINVIPKGEVCHKGTFTCWGEARKFNINSLETIIEARAAAPIEESYTARLLQRGMAKVAQKVGEEAVEVVIEAMKPDRERFIEESADLWYHWLVLAKAMNVTLGEVEKVLEGRN